jgi:hypothetical protein
MITHTQYSLKTMAQTVQGILSALYRCIAKLGCGFIGYDLDIDYGRTTKSR